MFRKVITWLALGGAALESVLALLEADRFKMLGSQWAGIDPAAKAELFFSYSGWLFFGLTVFLIARVWKQGRAPLFTVLGFALLLTAVAGAWMRAQTAEVFSAAGWSLHGSILLLEAAHLIWPVLIVISLAAGLFCSGPAARVLAVGAGVVGVIRVIFCVLSEGIIPASGPQSLALLVSLLVSLWLFTGPYAKEKTLRFRS